LLTTIQRSIIYPHTVCMPQLALLFRKFYLDTVLLTAGIGLSTVCDKNYTTAAKWYGNIWYLSQQPLACSR